MTDKAIKKIENYLRSELMNPLIIDYNNYFQLEEIFNHFDVNENIRFVGVEKYSTNDDELPQIELVLDALKTSDKIIFLIHFSSYLRLIGEPEITQRLKEVLALSVENKVVIFTYQCDQYLNFQDIRLNNQIFKLGGDKNNFPKISFINTEMETVFFKEAVCLKLLPKKLEEEKNELLVKTKRHSSDFSSSALNITEISSYYDMLGDIDSSILSVDESLGSKEQWGILYKGTIVSGSIESFLNKKFRDINSLDLLINSFKNLSDIDNWLLFVALKLKGTKGSNYLNIVVNCSENFEQLIKNIYRKILDYDVFSDGFLNLYKQRKYLIQEFAKDTSQISDFCRYVMIKEENSIYYLTDSSQLEKETILKCLDKYADFYSIEKLNTVLGIVYPDLNYYLGNSYIFAEPFLQNYFSQYRYQKIINKVKPEFISLVNEQAVKREYLKWLPSRISVIESINTTNAEYFFVDAMGVEYLSYIVTKCKAMNLTTSIKVCHSELPSITECNKDFEEYFKSKNLHKNDIKELDEIKHHGKDDFDYNKTKLPYHLIRELQIINELIEKISTKLGDGLISKAILISDHGASRLAVINNSEVINVEGDSKGSHGGRICEYSDDLPKLDFAIQEGTNVVLANYDRFRGSRAPSVETHGGATLEEVSVPIIEIVMKTENIEIELVTKEISVSFRKKAEIVLFVTSELNELSISIDNKNYSGIKNDNLFTFNMPEIKRAGEYSIDVYSSGELLKKNLILIVKKEGSSENDLF